ncbi:MAG: hypothetical protein QOI80_3483 [Solirubrobacteraceae bacterium]|nr:hypothetical protein [Solirubrobacteraceae bacterium]
MTTFQLAQVNLARPLAPLDSPQLAPFMAELEPVNANADGADGFVWRLQTDAGDATALRVFGGSMMINLSVWESLEALRTFVYGDPDHLAIMRRRREFFERIELVTALWWVAAGHGPDLGEAEARYDRLRLAGPTPEAFTFQRHFPPPDAEAAEAVDDDRDLCPA